MRRSFALGALAAALLVVPGAAAEQFQSSELKPGAWWEHTFDAPTTFTFHDHKNPDVEGTLTVTADDDGSTAQHDIRIRDDGGDVRFEPAEVTVEVGDLVRWTNSGSQLHQVMGWTEGDEPTMHDMGDMGHDDEMDHGAEDHAHGHGHGNGTDAEAAGPAFAAAMLAVLAVVATARRRG